MLREDGFETGYKLSELKDRNPGMIMKDSIYLRLFGLDKFNASKAPQPDGAFDFLVNQNNYSRNR
jgi:hypothetical protein